VGIELEPLELVALLLLLLVVVVLFMFAADVLLVDVEDFLVGDCI
jgi:hypothetical protein